MRIVKVLEPWTAAHTHLDYEYKSMNISLLNSTKDAPETSMVNENTAEYSCVPM
jgi:hypothetical protein